MMSSNNSNGARIAARQAIETTNKVYIRRPYYRTGKIDNEDDCSINGDIAHLKGEQQQRLLFQRDSDSGRRHRLIEMSVAHRKVISSRDSIEFDLPPEEDDDDVNYQSEEDGGTTTASEDGYYSNERPVFSKTASDDSNRQMMVKTRREEVGMPRSQLSVPEVRLRSHSTPTSPDINAVHSSNSSNKVQKDKLTIGSSRSNTITSSSATTLSPYGNQPVPMAIRKHSYDARQREIRSVDGDTQADNNKDNNFPRLSKRHTDLSLSTGSVRRRLPPTPCSVDEKEFYTEPTIRITLQQVKSSSYNEAEHSRRNGSVHRKPKFNSCSDEYYRVDGFSSFDYSSNVPQQPTAMNSFKSRQHCSLDKSSKQQSFNRRDTIDSKWQKSSVDFSPPATGGNVSPEKFIRQGTGRKLPKAPDFSSEIKRQGYCKQHVDDEMAISVRSCQTPPPPTAVTRVSSNSGYQPNLHTTGCSSPHSRKLCQRRTSDQSIEQYVGIACTCNIEKPESRSSQSTEEHDTLLSLDSRANSFLVSTPTEKPVVPILSVKDNSETPPKLSSPVADIIKAFSMPMEDKSYGLGKIKFSLQYFAIRKRLRVNIISAEGLAGRLKPDLVLNTLVKVCLMPGKLQKQCGNRIIKNTRDAIYNEEFFFDNLCVDDLKNLTLSIFVCHNVGKQFQKDVLIGEADLPLHYLVDGHKGEVKVQRELKPKLIKKLGKIRISTCLESDARRLTINVFKADDLPKFGITGAPDPCVKITLNQNGRIQTKQTRTLKNTCNPVFKEAVMFLVSVRQEDIDNADLTISVVDHSRDDVIGCVYLGVKGREKAEIDQWKNTLANEGKEIKGTHCLRAPE